MKVSGFTIIRNAVRFDFPIVEAITSVLPIVDEFVVNVGKCDDGTLELVRSIETPKIKIIETEWDDMLRTDGKIFGMQQDIALSHCTGDWAILVQADEVLHEDDYPEIRNAMERYLPHRDILGLVLKMVHFKGDYWSIDPWMYRKATRIVRNHCGVRSATDGCDFCPEGTDEMIKSKKGCHGRLIEARVFHYGYARSAVALNKKLQYQISRHDGGSLPEWDIALQARVASAHPTSDTIKHYGENAPLRVGNHGTVLYDILKDYKGTHPGVMKARIGVAMPLRRRRNRWLNLRFYKEILTHGFHG